MHHAFFFIWKSLHVNMLDKTEEKIKHHFMVKVPTLILSEEFFLQLSLRFLLDFWLGKKGNPWHDEEDTWAQLQKIDSWLLGLDRKSDTKMFWVNQHNFCFQNPNIQQLYALQFRIYIFQINFLGKIHKKIYTINIYIEWMREMCAKRISSIS